MAAFYILILYHRSCETHIQCKDQCVCWVNVDCQEAETVAPETEKPIKRDPLGGDDYLNENAENAVRYLITYHIYL